MPLRIGYFLFILLLFIAPAARASHLYGADIYYEVISGNTYRINLTLYGDCNLNPNVAFGSLSGATPIVHVFDGTSWKDSLILQVTGPGEEVTPVCQRELTNTTCQSVNGTIPGVMRFTYTAVYTFPYRSSGWRFRFDANTPFPNSLGVAYSAGRSVIDNIAAGSLMALEARLDNTSASNSSPRFTTIPTPFYCINVPQQYNHGAVDANGDSLDYALIPGLRGGGSMGLSAGGGTVPYVSPYSGTLPMNGDATGWSFSNTTGQLNFTPTVANKYLIVNEVKEYRNGKVIGTSMREMTFIILANCNITPSVSNLDTARTYKTGVFLETDRVTICQVTDTARFAIVPTNKSGDTIEASVTGLPSGITHTVYTNNTPRPTIVLTWNKANLAPGLYNFFVTYKDRGCPLTSTQTKAFTLRVVAPNDITGPVILAPTNCYKKAKVQFTPILGLAPRTITISKNGTKLITYRDLNGAPFTDSLLAGTYTVDILSDNLECPTQRTIVVKDSGEYPFPPKAEGRFHCLNDPPMRLQARADSGGTVFWYLPDGTPLPQAPTPPTDVAGRSYFLINQQVRVCKSPKDTFWVYVTKRPVAAITGDLFACEFDTGRYTFSGSIGEGPILEYRWFWDKAYYTSGEGPGPWKVAWGLAGKKTITLQVLENKCPSDTTEFLVTVRPMPYAGFEMPEEACAFDTVSIRYQVAPLDSQTFDWTFSGGSPATATTAGPFGIHWDSAGVHRVSLTASVNGCTDIRYKDILVHPVPVIDILNVPGTVCIGEKIYLQASGAISYTWHPEDSMRSDENGLYTHILKPSTYTVIGRNQYFCWDSASISYPVVENCCTFGYPNAFTPNGDGRNDKFNVVSYGNHLHYQLSIYNRWGQRVYFGHDSHQGWDGTFGGKPCDAGTYYYYFNALCYTGHREVQKGDIILIR